MAHIPGAPTWVQDMFREIDARQETLKEEFRQIVQSSLSGVVTQMETCVSQMRGYSTAIGQGLARLENFEMRLAKVEDKHNEFEVRLDKVEDIQSRDVIRPPAKTSAARPAPAPARGPQLAAVAAIAGKVDHTPTIPAPASTTPPEKKGA